MTHRIATEWNQSGRNRLGVFVPRRDSPSRLNPFSGGHHFPGIQHHAQFSIREDGHRFRIEVSSDDGNARLRVNAEIFRMMPPKSVFSSVDDVSRFFEAGSLGYSLAEKPEHFDGMELRSNTWHVEPLSVRHVESSYFIDTAGFPAGAVTFDNALLDTQYRARMASIRTILLSCSEEEKPEIVCDIPRQGRSAG